MNEVHNSYFKLFSQLRLYLLSIFCQQTSATKYNGSIRRIIIKIKCKYSRHKIKGYTGKIQFSQNTFTFTLRFMF